MSGERGATDYLEVLTEDERTHVVIRPVGEVDLGSARLLAHALEVGADGTRPVVLELAGVSFIDGSGLRVLIDARRRLGDRLIARPGPRQVQRLLAITGVDRELWREPLPHDAEVLAAAANVTHLRRLWNAYRRGGAAALTDLLAHPAPPGDAAWGPAELGGFWAAAATDGRTARYETFGDSIMVVCGEDVVPEITWTLYVYEGRTFIRAIRFDSESAARAYATSRRRRG